MRIFSIISPALDALQAGRELKNVAAWKSVQTVALLLSSLLALAAAFGVDLGLTQEQILGTAGTIAAIAGYLVPATSARVGFSSAKSEIDEHAKIADTEGGAADGDPIVESNRVPTVAASVRSANAGSAPQPSHRGGYDDFTGDH